MFEYILNGEFHEISFQVGVIDISSRLVLSTVGNYPGVTEVIIDYDSS